MRRPTPRRWQDDPRPHVPVDRDAPTTWGCLRGMFALLLAAALIVFAVWFLMRGAHGQESAESAREMENRLATTWQDVFRAAIANPGVSEGKRDLFRQALAHSGEVETFTAHTVYYHPGEAGAKWEDWAGTATGTLVRPGVASCTEDHIGTWRGAWIWYRGHGLCKVEDNFPEAGGKHIFDLAVWATPRQTYTDWLHDPTRVQIARTRNVYTEAIVVKPRGGWEEGRP